MLIMDNNENQGPLAKALTQEHIDIDNGIETYIATAESSPDPVEFDTWTEPLLQAMQALRRHIYLEEEFLFPKLSQGGRMMAIMVMYREHGEIWRAMAELDQLLATGSEDSVAKCSEMLDMLDKHNQKEEPVIYPHLDTELDQNLQEKLNEFLQTGSMPEGWTCKNA